MDDWKKLLRQAIDAKGSQAKLAAEMSRCGAENCSQSKISWLLKVADKISAEDALAIHRATQGIVPASGMRPDIWPSEQHVPLEPEQAAQ